MNLQNLSDSTLLKSAQDLAASDRRTLTILLHHLQEIDRRRLYSALRYPSLLDYTVHELKYSESEAIRRISAMRLLRECPEIEEKISSGQLNLTNLNLAQALFAHEKRHGRACAKSELLKQLENKSTREAQKIVQAIAPALAKLKTITYEMIEDDRLREKLLQVRGRLAHTHPNLTLTELLHFLCDLALELPKGRHAQIWSRDQNRCVRCGSTYALEVDHILPRAAGGDDSPENLRLLCRSCNQRAAVEYFGMEKMESHLRCRIATYSSTLSM